MKSRRINRKSRKSRKSRKGGLFNFTNSNKTYADNVWNKQKNWANSRWSGYTPRDWDFPGVTNVGKIPTQRQTPYTESEMQQNPPRTSYLNF